MYSGAGRSISVTINILFDGENISFDASLVIYINSTSIPPIIIMNRIYENQNLLYILRLIKHAIVVCVSSISPMAIGCFTGVDKSGVLVHFFCILPVYKSVNISGALVCLLAAYSQMM
jgi:hypothetical protein